jgi:hypothetical protein
VRDYDRHCPTCTCPTDTTRVLGDDTAPMFPLVLAVERAWHELMEEDRALGLPMWRPYTRSAA